MGYIEIKKVTTDNIGQLRKISIQTFAETFSPDNSEENMKLYMNKSFSEEQLKTELNDRNSEFYFAVRGDKVIGYLKINSGEAQTELKNENSLEIERIYVLKEFHGKRAGQQLYEKAIAIARQKGVDYIWLGVSEENPRAVRFYRKNGFVEFDKHIFRLGNDGQTDMMMKVKIK